MEGPTPGLRFMFLADSQIGCMATFSGTDAEAAERFARRRMCVRPFPHTESLAWDIARYRDAIDAANRHRPDFVVIGGDMIDAIDRPDQLEAFRRLTDELDGIDIHYVPGNHDAAGDGTIPTDESLAWYADTFGPDHYSFTADLASGGATASFIVVNSTLLDQPRKVPGGDERELVFLEHELRAARARPGPTVVFSHHPPFVDDPDEPDVYWNLPRPTRRTILDLLVEHDVDLLLCGHRHRNDHATYDGVEIVTSGASGFPLGLDAPGYRMVEVTAQDIRHAYHGFDHPGWDDIGGPPVDTGC